MWLFSSRKTGRTPPARRRSPAYRPRLEPLDDRCLLSAGALDPTFGNGAGYVTTSLSNADDRIAWDVLLQPDGKVIATGQADIVTVKKNYNVFAASDFAAVRYNTDGSLDKS